MPDEATDKPVAEEVLLVLRARGGDARAFEEIVGRYHRRVFYFVRKMVGREDRAEDAVQELWIDVWRSIGKLREPGALAPWLYRLARDRVYRQLRKDGRHAGESMADAEPAGDGPAPDDEYFRAEEAARVHAALDRLPAVQREVLLLRFVEQMAYPEIAAVVGCEVGTVRSRLHYGKRALKELLTSKESGHDEGTERTRIAAGGR